MKCPKATSFLNWLEKNKLTYVYFDSNDKTKNNLKILWEKEDKTN